MEATEQQIRKLKSLLESGDEHAFYISTAWRSLRAEVLKTDRYECQLCKARGRYAQAEIVHHVKHLRDRPDLALSITDPKTGERQLISICKNCHEKEHPEALKKFEQQREPLTEERWD